MKVMMTATSAIYVNNKVTKLSFKIEERVLIDD